MQYFDFLGKLHIQGLKLSGKVALFGPLGPSKWVWPFGPILDLQGPKYPK